MEAEMIGYANATATFFGTILLLKLGKYSDKNGRRIQYLLGLIGYPSLFVLLSIFHQTWAVFAIWSLPIYVLLRPVLPAMISDLTSENERSRGMSLITIFSTLAMSLGAMFFGYIVDVTGNLDYWTIFPAVLGNS